MDLKTVNRFVSTLAGTFRSFYIYNQDNKAFEEILQNLAKRFQDTQNPPGPIELTITNRNLLYDGEPTGFGDITVALASLLRNLGYKSIRFQPPIQSRNFFQFLHIITGKDSTESKNEKLVPLIADGESKPLSLVPLTANSFLLKLSDEALSKRLAPLRVPKAQGGPGFLEKLSTLKFSNTADYLLWTHRETGKLPLESLQAFSQAVVNATREGYFPWERFTKLFPGGDLVQNTLLSSSISHWSLFTTADIQTYRELHVSGTSASQDLDLAARLMAEPGSSNFTFGLSLLLRSMSEKNPLATQEKALKLGIQVWKTYSNNQESLPFLSLLFSLREKLASPTNIALTLFNIRNSAFDTPIFTETIQYLRSLGSACLPALIRSLDEEKDRGMRRKLCQVIPAIAREDGTEILIEALNGATPFLLRNLILILGDMKATSAVPAIIPCLTHAQSIVREEAAKSLTKIGTDEAKKALARSPQ
ncbi:MAG: hypothetical protein KCHDKBKB_00864 [Elusimicrobia bacterium]|nr:hypothetical protein [Elusimicrobiota bacterium]